MTLTTYGVSAVAGLVAGTPATVSAIMVDLSGGGGRLAMISEVRKNKVAKLMKYPEPLINSEISRTGVMIMRHLFCIIGKERQKISIYIKYGLQGMVEAPENGNRGGLMQALFVD